MTSELAFKKAEIEFLGIGFLSQIKQTMRSVEYMGPEEKIEFICG